MRPDREELLPGLELLRLSVEGDALRAEVRVAAGSPLFRGHFPGRPVLPGVALVGMIVALRRRASATEDLALRGLERVKLMAPVSPGARLSVTMKGPRFEVVTREGQRVATGALSLQGGRPGALEHPP